MADKKKTVAHKKKGATTASKKLAARKRGSSRGGKPSAAHAAKSKRHISPRRPDTDEAILNDLQKKAFTFFAKHVDPKTGLVLDSTQPESPSSIAAVGFALSCYPIAVERGFIKRKTALSHTLAALRFFDKADQSGAVDGVGYKGFFYHFLHPQTGKRAWKSELSTIDTTLLLAGMLVASQYFDGDTATEREIRERTASVNARIDWRWAQQDLPAIVLGWKPETGFIPYRWQGYNEAMLLYVLALGSPQSRVDPDAYAAWTSTFKWRRLYGHDMLYAGPLFIHQFSHIWIDLRGIQDEFMSARKTDYFDNSRVATQIQREYAIRNPRKFAEYREDCWGYTASDGPGDDVRKYRGRKHRFYGYMARGAPFGPDDGTLSPWAAIASLPFAPDIVLDEIRHLEATIGHSPSGFGFHASYNPSYPAGKKHLGWVSPWHYALNQGPIVLMIENYRTGMIWRLMRECGPIKTGLQRAGFGGGWLSASK
ncbi:MAG: glucoamylase family protein [Rhodanobacteraceae bacterium]